MSATLYLLRQQPDRISPSLFSERDIDVNVVVIEDPMAIAFSCVKGAAMNTEGMLLQNSRQAYEDLIEKIFSSEHVIVI